jgi:hypothetical protein
VREGDRGGRRAPAVLGSMPALEGPMHDRGRITLGAAAHATDPPGGGPRERVVDAAARDAGDRWAEACRASLAKEGRLVEGGWPGTLSEARVRVAAHVGHALVEHAMSALTYDELGRAARLTYERARSAWLATPRRKRRRAPRSGPETI